MRRLACALLLAGCAAPVEAPAAEPLDAAVATWQPLVLERADAVRPAAPAADTAADLAELRGLARSRTVDDMRAILYWDALAPSVRWSALAKEQVQAARWSVPRNARAMALVHAAIYDAAIACWDAKQAYQRAAPVRLDPALLPLVGDPGLPSYPSEHAAIAYAAATVLAGLRPTQRDILLNQAWGAAETRVAGGAALRMDVAAGQALGEAVAARVLARAAADNSDALAHLPLEVQPGQWTVTYPAEAVAGSWQPWWVTDVAVPSPAPVAGAALAEAEQRALAASPAQLAEAGSWDQEGPALQWNERARALLAERHLSTPRSARVLALLHVALADAAIACWRSMYQVLEPRPAMADPTFTPPLPAPSYPPYPDAVACEAAAAAGTLTSAFPEAADDLGASAASAVDAGVAAGRNMVQDGRDGAALGRQVADAVNARAGR